MHELNRETCECGSKSADHKQIQTPAVQATEWIDNDKHPISLPTNAYGDVFFENSSGKVGKVC